MSDLAYDISLVAPGPNAVKGGFARPTGLAGNADYFYWVVAHFPIGVSISGPIPILNAPDVLTAINAVLISWDTEMGATSYTVLRTATPVFPAAAGNYVVLGGIAPSPGISTAIDQGQALTAFTPTTLTYGSPVNRHIYLNNRDYSQPTIEMPPIKVGQITFPDGSSINSVSGAVGQSPWVGNIDADGFALQDLGSLDLRAGGNIYFNGKRTISHDGSASYLRCENPGAIIFECAGVELGRIFAPSRLFEIPGNAKIGTSSGALYAKADANILLYDSGPNNWAGLGADTDGVLWIKTGLTGAIGRLRITPFGDFQFETDTRPSMFRLEPTGALSMQGTGWFTGNVGIGSVPTAFTLEVGGTLHVTGAVTLSAAITTTVPGAGTNIVYRDASGFLKIAF